VVHYQSAGCRRSGDCRHAHAPPSADWKSPWRRANSIACVWRQLCYASPPQSQVGWETGTQTHTAGEQEVQLRYTRHTEILREEEEESSREFKRAQESSREFKRVHESSRDSIQESSRENAPSTTSQHFTTHGQRNTHHLQQAIERAPVDVCHDERDGPLSTHSWDGWIVDETAEL
jgi:hypothetical protein